MLATVISVAQTAVLVTLRPMTVCNQILASLSTDTPPFGRAPKTHSVFLLLVEFNHTRTHTLSQLDQMKET